MKRFASFFPQLGKLPEVKEFAKSNLIGWVD